MERRRGAAVISFVHAGPLAVGEIALDEDAAHHARVRRVVAGDAVRLLDGAGTIAGGRFASVGKRDVVVAVDSTTKVAPPPEIHIFVPVADRDRMLIVAEKVVELGVAVWQPVYFERSRNVTPRGDGEAFERKVQTRMRGALEQSGGAWLPERRPPIEFDDALADTSATRFLLDADGERLSGASATGPVAAMIGPEGGLTVSERAAAIAAGWRPVRIEGNILRFETAAIVATGIIRTLLLR